MERTGLLRTDTSSQAVDRLIAEACTRNVPAELHYEDSTGTIITGRVRLLQLTDTQVLADKPVHQADGEAIPAGVRISVHMMLNGSRYQFESVIEDPDCPVRLNARQLVRGIALRRPDVVDASQRRAHLRISAVGYDPISVRLVRPHPEVPDACRIDARVITGRLQDLSAGGLSVLVDKSTSGPARVRERFFLTFVLPTVADEFLMLGLLRHSRLIERSALVRLGLAFRPWRRAVFRQQQRRILQFVADHERRFLRRRR